MHPRSTTTNPPDPHDAREVLARASAALGAIRQRARATVGDGPTDAIFVRALRDAPSRWPSIGALELRRGDGAILHVDARRARDIDASAAARDARGFLIEILTVFDTISAGALTPALRAILESFDGSEGTRRAAGPPIEGRRRS